MKEDSEIWYVIYNRPYVPMEVVKEGEISLSIPKTNKDNNEADRKKIKKN